MATVLGQSCWKPCILGPKFVFNFRNENILSCRPLLSLSKSFGSGDKNDKTIIKKCNHPGSERKDFPLQRKRIVSPIARLSRILPSEVQATDVFHSDKAEYSESKISNTTELTKNSVPENVSYASQFEWSEPDQESADNHTDIDIRNMDNDRRYDKKILRKRTFSPLQRLSGHLLKDLNTDLNKETVELPYSNVQLSNGHFVDKREKCIKLHNESEVIDVPKLSPQTFQYGCLVVLYLFGWTKSPQEYRYMFRLARGEFFHIKSYGNLSHDKLVDREPGEIIKIAFNKMALIAFPTLEDFITLMPKILVAANPKTVSSMINKANIQEGSRVLEAGSGTGGTTLLLSRAVGSSGQVYSMEKDKKMSELAQENVDKWNNQLKEVGYDPCKNISFLQGDITKLDDSDLFNVDAVFLDMKNPFDALENVSKHLKTGAAIVVYTPSVSTVLSCVREVHNSCPSLRVEGVFEDAETLWKVRGHISAENKCQPYKRDERQTLFILKMIKTENVSKQLKSYTGQGTHFNSSSIFNYGDYVCVEYLNQNRKGKRIQVVTKLTDSGHLALPQHNLRQSDVIGTHPGSVLRLENFPPLLVSLPTLETFVETLAGNRGLLSLQHHRLICHALDIKKGDTVLHIGRQCNQCTASAAYFSRTVGETGRVFLVTGNEMLEQCENNIETWREICSQRTGRDVSKKIHLEADLHEICSDIHFDGISSDLPLNSLVENLPFISARMKMGKSVAVFFPSVTSVLQLDRYLSKSNLPLHIKQVYEEREREWIVQPVKITNSKDDLKYDESNWPYVCRPKQKTTSSNSGFIAILQKAIQME